MLRLAVIALVLAIVAGAFGAGHLEYLATKAALVLAGLAVLLFVIGLIGRGPGAAPPAI